MTRKLDPFRVDPSSLITKINSDSSSLLSQFRRNAADDRGRIEQAERDTILVVEDELQVLKFIALALGRFGYTVLQANDGEKALAMLSSLAAPVDLLLTDVCMPGMTGIELAARVKAHYPEQPVLFMTGYADPFLHGQPPSSRVIHKPFTPRELSAKIEQLLARGRAGQRGFPAAS